ncbi:amidase family protein [Mycolicibacterium sp. jd]|uniref:amidase family protein n=1 Tax=unclassified Mycolicibacterium TaxID=2636767 RepID=UPI00351B9B40
MTGQTIDGALAPAGRTVVPPTGRGACDGVRVAVKDLFDVAGTVTAAGNPTLAAGPAAAHHAAAVAALLSAGATVVAKTATDELAMGMFGVNAHYGTPPNPAAPDRVPGGSSSGSASLVAGGQAELGLGTDTGGSIRVPAAFCGLAGLRTTHGRIDTAGVRAMAPEFDTVGLMAVETSFLAKAFSVLTTPRTPREVTALVLLTDLAALASADVAARTRATAARWAERLGLPLRTASLGGGPDPVRVFWPLMSAQLWDTNGAWVAEARPVLGTGIAERIRAAASVTDAEVEVAEAQRTRFREHLHGLLAGAVAVLPTTMDAAPARTADHAALMAYRDRNLAFVVPASLAGAPQLTVPQGTVTDAGCGTDAPVGASLLGLPGDDELLLSLAEAVQ